MNWYKFDLAGQKTLTILLHHAQNENPKSFQICGLATLDLETATKVQ